MDHRCGSPVVERGPAVNRLSSGPGSSTLPRTTILTERTAPYVLEDAVAGDYSHYPVQCILFRADGVAGNLGVIPCKRAGVSGLTTGLPCGVRPDVTSSGPAPAAVGDQLEVDRLPAAMARPNDPRGGAVAARQAHNLEVGGSNPPPVTTLDPLPGVEDLHRLRPLGQRSEPAATHNTPAAPLQGMGIMGRSRSPIGQAAADGRLQDRTQEEGKSPAALPGDAGDR